MKTYITQYGWDGDGGIGDQLIADILSGKKHATCSLKALYNAHELEQLYESIGNVTTIVDKYGRSVCQIKITGIFETTLGEPDDYFLKVLGFENDRMGFIKSRKQLWKKVQAEVALDDNTPVVAEVFELIGDTYKIKF